MVHRRGVLLATYGMVQHNAEALAEHEGHDPDDGPLWDIMICGAELSVSSVPCGCWWVCCGCRDLQCGGGGWAGGWVEIGEGR